MAGRKRILLVDDDESVRFVLRASLLRMSLNPEVVTARDGLEAYRHLQTDTFDLLVTDICLTGLDGVSLTRAARSIAPALPVIWITAYGCAAYNQDALLLGVYCCMEKPMEMGQFRQLVRQALAAPQESLSS